MSQNNHIIVFSHGFGVDKSDRGIFTDIADSLKNVESVMFDYNDIDEEKNQTTAKPFSQQAEILKKTLENVRKSNPNAIIDIICHSQGSIIAALARPEGIRKIIFTAPPFSADIERSIKSFSARPETKINLEGVSRLARKDGSTTIVPAEYWAERKSTNVIELYKQLAKVTELIIINANQDNILGEGNCSDVENAEIINIDGDHGFHGEDRKKLLEVIADKIRALNN